MEGDNMDMNISGGGGGGGGAGTRWNPTKEQIEMLEGLYKQGLRTPSADQIQQITIRLKVFGHIEGKNVFYWFQNHKARQRQKQKQDYYTSRFLLHHKTPPPNVVYSPFYVQCPEHSGIYPNLLVHRGLKRKPMETENIIEVPKQINVMENSRKFYEGFMMNNNNNMDYDLNGRRRHQTLDLFPQQPSGNLQSRNSFGNHSAETSSGYNVNYSVSDQQPATF